MDNLPLTLLIGFFAGFFGAIPPGPLNVSILRKTLHGQRRDAFKVAFGGAAIDALICGVIGLGLGWALERVVTNRWVRGFLALFLLAYGLKLLFWDLKREEEVERLAAGNNTGGGSGEVAAARRPTSRLPFLTGILQGAANPALVVNWTLLIGFLVGHRLLVPRPVSAGAFALGVGIGVFAWFGLVIELLSTVSDRAGTWVKRSTAFAGFLLVLFGVFFTIRSVSGILGP
ncbi:MAG TPA: LysE family transporter [Thermoanaerobaculia bacterium]|nr:LysE family transporter [Thermoanaerobaculia bacterium]